LLDQLDAEEVGRGVGRITRLGERISDFYFVIGQPGAPTGSKAAEQKKNMNQLLSNGYPHDPQG
jgi:hypothetical protein